MTILLDATTAPPSGLVLPSASYGFRRWHPGTSDRTRRKARCRPRVARDRRHRSATGPATPPAARALRATDEPRGIGGTHHRCQPQQRRRRQTELLDHHVERTELAAMAPEH